MMMQIPVFADYMRCASLKENFKLMTRLLRGKVPLADAVDIIVESTNEPASRIYWTECKDRLMAGVEPSRALRRWPLTKAECDQITTIQSVDQLAEVFDALGEEREDMTKTYRRKVMVTAVALAMVVVGAVILNAIFLLWIQNEGTFNDIKSVGGG
jgi:type II secretory pathway component PulF